MKIISKIHLKGNKSCENQSPQQTFSHLLIIVTNACFTPPCIFNFAVITNIVCQSSQLQSFLSNFWSQNVGHNSFQFLLNVPISKLSNCSLTQHCCQILSPLFAVFHSVGFADCAFEWTDNLVLIQLRSPTHLFFYLFVQSQTFLTQRCVWYVSPLCGDLFSHLFGANCNRKLTAGRLQVQAL